MIALNSPVDDWRGTVFNVADEDTKWLEGCYVANTFNPEGVLSLQNNLRMEGVFSIKTIPMGGTMFCFNLRKRVQ